MGSELILHGKTENGPDDLITVIVDEDDILISISRSADVLAIRREDWPTLRAYLDQQLSEATP